MKHDAAAVSLRLPESRPRAMQAVSDLISLGKPKIIVLLLISTLCPMVLAAGGSLDFGLALVTLLGGALLSASASAVNCVWDRDIDRIMERTKDRPMAAGRLSPRTGYLLALFTGALGFALLWKYTNHLAAWLGLFGHLFYVFVYTIWLKRTSVQNIVIGGAAGAMPPLVGWAAVTGSVNLTAFLLFLVIFLWTPPHFWALALNKNEDYRRAGVPMLPVVAGEQATFRQMLLYVVLLFPAAIAMVLSSDELGLFSLLMLVVLSTIFAMKVFALSKAPAEARERRAWDVFGFSLIYLALFFFCLVVDSVLV